MITYVLTLSRTFPSTHRRAGELTNFRSALGNALMCAKCREKPKGMCVGECVAGKVKRHTIRANYDFWAKRFEKIAAGKAVLSVREWVGKPYGKGSTQREIALLTKDDGIGIQRLEFENGSIWHTLIEGRSPYYPSEIAERDGLSLTDWLDWFRGYDLSCPMAIIHFTNFRYNR
ncbi:MAG: hypothetical protein IJM04_04195 [Prevotella sp.]|nr:hypothetical protein [Prevotella sp.]